MDIETVVSASVTSLTTATTTKYFLSRIARMLQTRYVDYVHM